MSALCDPELLGSLPPTLATVVVESQHDPPRGLTTLTPQLYFLICEMGIGLNLRAQWGFLGVSLMTSDLGFYSTPVATCPE